MMNEITFCDLREKEVINTVDGKKLGRVVDLVMTCSGDVLGFIVPGEKRLLRALSSCDTLFVPWKCIVKIGEDAILVKLTGNAAGAVCGSVDDDKKHHEHNDCGCVGRNDSCGDRNDSCGGRNDGCGGRNDSCGGRNDSCGDREHYVNNGCSCGNN